MSPYLLASCLMVFSKHFSPSSESSTYFPGTQLTALLLSKYLLVPIVCVSNVLRAHNSRSTSAGCPSFQLQPLKYSLLSCSPQFNPSLFRYHVVVFQTAFPSLWYASAQEQKLFAKPAQVQLELLHREQITTFDQSRTILRLFCAKPVAPKTSRLVCLSPPHLRPL